MRSSPRKMRGEEVEGGIPAARKRKLENEPDQQQVIIGGTIDKLKTRVKGKKELKEEDMIQLFKEACERKGIPFNKEKLIGDKKDRQI